jgi:hypothetical protein
LEDLVRETNEF